MAGAIGASHVRRARAMLRLTPILLLPLARANIYTYESQLLAVDDVEYRRVGMWAPADLPHRHGGAIVDASISVDLAFRRSDARRSGLVQVTLFNAEQMPRVGAVLNTGGGTRRAFCCTSALVKKVPGCDAAGQIIVAPPPASADGEAHKRHHHEVSVHDVAFPPNASDAHLSQRLLVKQSGIHYLLLSSCEPRTGSVRFSGRTEWRNPHGYLPGELYPYLPFFGILTLAYLALLTCWALLCYRHWANLLPLQGAIAVVLLLAACEAATWWRCFHAFNTSGTRGLLPTVLGVLISTIRKTVRRRHASLGVPHACIERKLGPCPCPCPRVAICCAARAFDTQSAVLLEPVALTLLRCSSL